MSAKRRDGKQPTRASELRDKYPLSERELTYMDTRGLKGQDVNLYMDYFHDAITYLKREAERKTLQYEKGGVKSQS